jgi:hypothetical protein
MRKPTHAEAELLLRLYELRRARTAKAAERSGPPRRKRVPGRGLREGAR